MDRRQSLSPNSLTLVQTLLLMDESPSDVHKQIGLTSSIMVQLNAV